MYEKELEIAKLAAVNAGTKILEVYHSGDFQIESKGDDSPVGRADKLSNIEIYSLLNKNFPSYGMLSEEALEGNIDKNALSKMKDSNTRYGKSEYSWVVDPLDGTRDFINKSGEFGVHIGLTKNNVPVLGINHYPVTGETYFAVKGEGAYKTSGEKITKLNTSGSKDVKDYLFLVSNNATDKKIFSFIEKNELRQPKNVGSFGLKICRIAEGKADAMVYFGGKASLWDICSGQVIIEEAGGKVTGLHGKPIDYSAAKDTYLDDGAIISNNKNHKALIQMASNFK